MITLATKNRKTVKGLSFVEQLIAMAVCAIVVMYVLPYCLPHYVKVKMNDVSRLFKQNPKAIKSDMNQIFGKSATNFVEKILSSRMIGEEGVAVPANLSGMNQRTNKLRMYQSEDDYYSD